MWDVELQLLHLIGDGGYPGGVHETYPDRACVLSEKGELNLKMMENWEREASEF